MSRFALPSEPFWQTTRVLPRDLVLRAEASERGLGTLPPAAGFTEVSGLGFGQYEVRSTCASATAAKTNNAAAANAAVHATRSTKPRINTTPLDDTRRRSVNRRACCSRRFPLQRSG